MDAGGAEAVSEDFSNAFSQVASGLVVSNGRPLMEAIKELQPRYAVVWTSIITAYVVILGGYVGLHQLGNGPLAWALAPFAAVVMGWFAAYLDLFLHEASHYGLARDRARNDLLANVFIGALFGQDVRKYRPIHFEHHRRLGTVDDPERSYFNALTTRFLIETLLGIHALRVLLRRQKLTKERQDGNVSYVNKVSLISLAIHGAVVTGSFVSGHIPAGLAWGAAFFSVFPFCCSIRQLLEHRDVAASPDIDYAKHPHGAISRMFGTGLVDSTLGGAGFNRHLLHHWLPSVSCSNLAQLERLLAGTRLEAIINMRRTTYWEAFRNLHVAR